jgi:hypothetical protein
MGELSKNLLEHAIQQSILGIIDDTMSSAKILHNLAQVLEEEDLDAANPNQLRESAVRCIDVIELLIEAATTQPSFNDYKDSPIARDLQTLRNMILGTEEQA